MDKIKNGVLGYQGVFLALTLVVMLIIIITSKDLPTAIVVIGLITNFLIISSQLTLIRDRHAATKGLGKIDRGLASSVTPNTAVYSAAMAEGFGGSFPADAGSFPAGSFPADEPGPAGPEGADAFSGAPALAGAGLENDADDLGDADGLGRDAPSPGPQAESDLCGDPGPGRPRDLDEMRVYHSQARNVPERVAAGSARKHEWLKPYVCEELEEEENSQWWGACEV